jgi:hypothetical protein
MLPEQPVMRLAHLALCHPQCHGSHTRDDYHQREEQFDSET